MPLTPTEGTKLHKQYRTWIKGYEEHEEGTTFTNFKTAPKNIQQENKPKPSLIPLDICIEYDEPAYREELIKYSRESWRLGFKVSDMFDATMRHLHQFFYCQEDWDLDAQKLGIKKHHIAGARFCLACILQTLRDHPELDDRKELFGESKENKIPLSEFLDDAIKQCTGTEREGTNENKS